MPTQAEEQPESQHSVRSLAQSNLRPPSRERGRCPMPARSWMDDKPTLSQTWAVNKSQPAICVQSVDAHMSCSSHSDAQFAAFFIDPRAK